MFKPGTSDPFPSTRQALGNERRMKETLSSLQGERDRIVPVFPKVCNFGGAEGEGCGKALDVYNARATFHLHKSSNRIRSEFGFRGKASCASCALEALQVSCFSLCSTRCCRSN